MPWISSFKINICRNAIEKKAVQKVYDWLVYAITIGRDSSQRAPTTQVHLPEPNDEETLTGEFSNLLLD